MIPIKQLKVETLRGNISKNTERIRRCLAKHPEGLTPKIISLKCSINVNTVKSILPKVPGIIKPMRGIYKVVERGDTPHSALPPNLTDWNFHNLYLSTELRDHPHKTVHSTKSLDLLNLKFIINKTGRVSVSVSTDTPLNVSALCLVTELLSEWVSKHSNDLISPKQVRVSSVEFNRDYSNLRFDGLRCITLESLISQFKAYQKRNGLRIEHKTKVPFTAANIIDILAANPQTHDLHMKLNSIEGQLRSLAIAVRRQASCLDALIQERGGNRK